MKGIVETKEKPDEKAGHEQRFLLGFGLLDHEPYIVAANSPHNSLIPCHAL
jgi:hypothetical protein